jgi:hypothetical protein
MPGLLAFSTFNAVSRATARAMASAMIYTSVHSYELNYGEGRRTCKGKRAADLCPWLAAFSVCGERQ